MSANHSDESGKRRLRLMNEVLPDPTAKADGGSPRARTLRHMQRLVAMAAASTALACARDAEPGIRKENETTKKKATTAEPTTTPSETASAKPTFTEPDPTNGPGYGVVDPMPPPARCAGAASSIKATGTVKSDKGGTYVELKMPKPTMADAKYDRKSPAYASGATLSGTTYLGDDMILKVVPTAGSTSFWVYASVTCTAGPEHVAIMLELSGTAPGSTVKLTLYDQY